MKKVLKILLAILLALVIAVGGYAAYLFIDYDRLEDQLPLDVSAGASGSIAAGEEQTIVTWNLGFGAYNADYSFFMDGGTESRAYSREICENNIQTAIDALQAMDADLMLLQEVDEYGTRSHHVDQVAMVRSAFGGDYSAVYAQNYDSGYLFYPVTKPIGANRGGIITLAGAEISDAVRFSLPIESGFRKFFDLDRCYSVSRIPVSNGRELALFNLHLSAYTADGTIATQQLELLIDHMQREYDAGNYVIAGGDFNKNVWIGETAPDMGDDVPVWAQAFPAELQTEYIRLVDSHDPQNTVYSCRDTGAPYVRGESFEITLDGFVVSDNVHVIECNVVDEGFMVSDHNPVLMRFVLEA